MTSEATKKDVEMKWWEKAMAMSVVIALMVIAFFVLQLFIKPDPEEAQRRAIEACGNSMFSYETSCPGPEDDPGLYR